MALDKKTILAFSDRQVAPVPCPEWGGEVYVRTMTGKERAAWDRLTVELMQDGRITDTGIWAANLVQMTCCDEKGNLVFTAADVAALVEKSGKVLERIALASLRLNAVGNSEVADERKVFPAAKA